MPLKATPALREYTALLVQLHRLMEAGEDDERGDALRDQMDAPWQRLSEDEVAFANWLSADLYKLNKKRDKHKLTGPARKLLEDVDGWVKQGRWSQVFHRIDDAAKYLDQDSAYSLKLRLARGAGCFEAAEAYAEAARQIKPERPEHAIHLMAIAFEAGHYNKAATIASRIIDNRAFGMARRSQALYLLMRCHELSGHGLAEAPLAEWASKVYQLHGQAKIEGWPSGSKKAITECYTCLVFAYRDAEMPVGADNALAAARQLSPNDPLVELAAISEQALGDRHEIERWERVRDANPTDWTPRIMLAASRVVEGEHGKAIEEAEAALQLGCGTVDESLPKLLIAIAKAELRRSQEETIAEFNEAMETNPVNEWVSRNRAVFLQWVESGKATSPNWQLPSSTELKRLVVRSTPVLPVAA